MLNILFRIKGEFDIIIYAYQLPIPKINIPTIGSLNFITYSKKDNTLSHQVPEPQL